MKMCRERKKTETLKASSKTQQPNPNFQITKQN